MTFKIGPYDFKLFHKVGKELDRKGNLVDVFCFLGIYYWGNLIFHFGFIPVFRIDYNYGVNNSSDFLDGSSFKGRSYDSFWVWLSWFYISKKRYYP